MSAQTQQLHDAIDARARREGVAWLHPEEPTVIEDNLGSQAIVDWQEAKGAATLLGERGWSEQPTLYARYGGPAVRELIGRVRGLEQAPAAVVTDCGMQAIALVADTRLQPGAHAIRMGPLYGKSAAYLAWLAPRVGASITHLPTHDPGALEAAIRPETRLVLAETMTNPHMRVLDLAAVGRVSAAARARAPGLRLWLDTTLTTPWGFRAPPLTLPGIDGVVASGTKALCGQDTVMWGYVAGREVSEVNRVMDLVALRGGILDGRRAAAAVASLAEAEARFTLRCHTAQRIAAALSAHPRVAEVFHSSLRDHPDRQAFEAGYALPGSLLSLRVEGADEPQSRHFCDVLTMTGVVRYATSFDGLVTKVNHHPSVSEYFAPPAALRRQNLDRIVRLAPGIEPFNDLWACLNWALWAWDRVSPADVVRWQTARRAALDLG
jgi:cystathionine beta-lyase/cystathionine gamma-synthase